MRCSGGESAPRRSGRAASLGRRRSCSVPSLASASAYQAAVAGPGQRSACTLHSSRFGSSLAEPRRVCAALQGFEAFDAAEKGTWEGLPAGSAALRLTIRSPGAGSHVVVFRHGTTLELLCVACHTGDTAPPAQGALRYALAASEPWSQPCVVAPELRSIDCSAPCIPQMAGTHFLDAA